ncbi:hypothetical protein LJK88_20140 [Paenibacillus sp. P26]|nr:hypothetical protein LJK88_20140 [Paenibacillus sp. P26]
MASMRAKRMRLFEACWTASPMRSRRCTACCNEALPAAEVRRMTLRQAEAALYGGNARDFFERQADRARAALASGSHAERLRQAVEQKPLHHPRWGLWAVYRSTGEEERHGLTLTVREWRLEAERLLAAGRAELDALYEESAGDLPAGRGGVFGLFGGGRTSVHLLAGALLDRIYGWKRER